MKYRLMFAIIIFLISTIILTGCSFIKNNNLNQEKLSNEYIGKWNTVMAINSNTGVETKSLREVFGSSFEEFGSYLELKEDGTFIDAIVPITDGSKSNTGTYIIKKDYYKLGDTYIFLSYIDGNEETLQSVKLDSSNESYLVLDSLINDYQLYLKK